MAYHQYVCLLQTFFVMTVEEILFQRTLKERTLKLIILVYRVEVKDFIWLFYFTIINMTFVILYLI